MLTVVTATAIAGAARLAIKRTSTVGVDVVGEYSIIELCIRLAISDVIDSQAYHNNLL